MRKITKNYKKTNILSIILITDNFIGFLFAQISFNCENALVYDRNVYGSGFPIPKINSSVSDTDVGCMINNYQSELESQPNIYIPGWNLTHATMNFENILPLNYTKEVETEPSEFIQASNDTSTYIYQKFSVEINQYVNNVSIFIQDYNNPLIYNDNNS